MTSGKRRSFLNLREDRRNVELGERGATEAPPGPNDRGLALILVAISMMLLMGLAAVAVDGSNLYRERGDTQNAADLAAYAAAYVGCTGSGDPVVAGKAQAAANGFTHDGVNTIVTLAEEGGNWRATVDSTIDGFFSKILGADTLSTSATAVASCTTSVVGELALFAGGTCGPENLKLEGNDNTIDGDVHSNDGMIISGNTNSINGSTTASGIIDVTGVGNIFNPPPQDGVPAEAWSVMFESSDFLPGGPVEAEVGSAYYHYWDGQIDSNLLDSQGWWDPVTKTLDTGVYVATDDIDLSDQFLNGTVTLVTAPDGSKKGRISLSGSDQDLDPYYMGLLAFSDAREGDPSYPWDPTPPPRPVCDQVHGIKLSGSDNKWEGLMFAPRSGVELSGSVNVTLEGSIVAYQITVPGSSQDLDLVGGASPVIVLVE